MAINSLGKAFSIAKTNRIARKVIMIGFMAVAGTPAVFSQNASSVPRDQGGGLSIRKPEIFVTMSHTKYSMNDFIVIDVGIRNDGRDPLYVYRKIAWGFGGGLVLRLMDQTGHQVAPVVRDDTMLPPPATSNDASIFVQLTEDDFFGTRRNLLAKDLVKAPGKYSLQVEYRSPLSRKFVDPKLRQLPALWHEDESIVSHSVPFEVVP